MLHTKKSKIKVALILPKLTLGGAERIVCDLLKQFQNDTQVQASLFCLNGNEKDAILWREFFAGQNLRIKFAINPWADIFLLKYFGKLIQLKRLKRLIVKNEINLVHTHLYAADILGALAARGAGVLCLSTEHNSFANYGYLKLHLKRFTNRYITRFAAVSSASVEYLKKDELVAMSKIKLVLNGIDVAPFKHKKRKNKKTLVVGSMGRLAEQKGFKHLLRALAILKNEDFICNIAGEPDPYQASLHADLEQQIRKYNLEGRVALVGRQEAVKFLAECDIFVLPSLWEGLSLVLLEAGAAGLPVVATSVGGTPELIIDGEDGLLCPPGSPMLLARRIKKLLQDQKLRERLAKNLEQKVLAHFDLEHFAKDYKKIYLDLLK